MLQAVSVPAHATINILPIWSVIPFVGILLSIALLPLLAPHFWHRHFGKISAFWALGLAVPFVILFRHQAVNEIAHILIIDYIPFIILIGSLFTISGGIVIRGSLSGTPVTNTTLLFIGAILASIIGTTGASMLMIRPVLRANSHRLKKAHIICFFIFLIANIGGSLTPIGDPPLFLGFLHSVPFFWVTTNMLPQMLLSTAIILSIFFIIDMHFFKKEEIIEQSENKKPGEPFKIEGKRNLLILSGIISCIIISGLWKPGDIAVLGISIPIQNIFRDLAILLLAAVSFFITPDRLRKANSFSWFPIIEVTKLFAGIFITIIPALNILKAGSNGALAGLVSAVDKPVHFFWATGILSSFLDNAPTYLSFFNLALGKYGLSEADVPAALAAGSATAIPLFISSLKAISAGSVFMGAITYIGNAPNFMVKSIAEESGVKMPSFFGYVFKYSIPVLIPVFILISLIFYY